MTLILSDHPIFDDWMQSGRQELIVSLDRNRKAVDDADKENFRLRNLEKRLLYTSPNTAR